MSNQCLLLNEFSRLTVCDQSDQLPFGVAFNHPSVIAHKSRRKRGATSCSWANLLSSSGIDCACSIAVNHAAIAFVDGSGCNILSRHVASLPTPVEVGFNWSRWIETANESNWSAWKVFYSVTPFVDVVVVVVVVVRAMFKLSNVFMFSRFSVRSLLCKELEYRPVRVVGSFDHSRELHIRPRQALQLEDDADESNPDRYGALVYTAFTVKDSG